MNGPDASSLVDWGRTARRMRASAIVLGTAALVGWLVSGLLRGDLVLSALGGWVALALLGLFVVEVVIVGGSALRGLLRAGDRGERLAGNDVSLLPPQLNGSRRRRDRSAP